MDVKKVAYELSAPFSKAGAPQADNDSMMPPEKFLKKKICLLKVLIEHRVIEKDFFNLARLYQYR